MGDKLNVVTGATGLLGSYIAEALVDRGERVRAVVRPSSNTELLSSLGVDLAVGDLTQPESLREPFRGGAVVYHCAAKVGDWGPWSEFYGGIVETTGNVVRACQDANVSRLLHVSSVSAYGRPAGDSEITEEAPLGQNMWLWDHYCRAKMLTEEEVLPLGNRVTIVRPTWFYGPRDRAVFPRILSTLRSGQGKILGSGDNKLNMVFAGDIADGVILAANDPGSAGEAYNLCGSGEITQRELFDALCDTLGLPPVKRRVSPRVAHHAAFVLEAIFRLLRIRRPPFVTRHGVALISRPTRFSSRKAQDKLGWKPKIDISKGLQRTLDWLTAKTAAEGNGDMK
jgi:nucleoside-diphosphate-sugar epimerase